MKKNKLIRKNQEAYILTKWEKKKMTMIKN